MKKVCLILITAFVSGCLIDETRDKNWYLANSEAREEKLNECRNHAKKMEEADCLNALQAEREISQQKQKELWKKWRS